MSGAPVTPWSGVPEHPERDGWHWVQNRYGAVVPALWIAEDGMWRLFNSDYSVKAAARNQTYLGPCMPPSDLAALRASHAEMLAACVATRDLLVRLHDGCPALTGEALTLLGAEIDRINAIIQAAEKEAAQ